MLIVKQKSYFWPDTNMMYNVSTCTATGFLLNGYNGHVILNSYFFSFFRCPWRHIEKPGTKCKWGVRWKTNGGWWRLPCNVEVGRITKKQLFLKKLFIPRMKEEIERERKLRYMIRFSYSFGIYFTLQSITLYVKSVLKMLETSGPKKKKCLTVFHWV